MRKSILSALFLFSLFVGAEPEKNILKIGNKNFIKSDFFALYPIEEWVGKDSLKKADMLHDWIKKELVFIGAEKKGFLEDPKLAIRIKDLKNVLMVNETYNHLVGRSLTDSSLINESVKFLRDQVKTHHILISYNSTRFAKQKVRP